MKCILCEGNDLSVLSEIAVTDLVRVYKNALKIDAAPEFGTVGVMSYICCNSCDLRFFSPLVTGSECFYTALSSAIDQSYYLEEKPEYEFASRFITCDDDVLDVGSGRGYFSRYVKGNYTGLDFNPQAIKMASAEGITVLNESLESHQANVRQAYSVVTAFQVLEHMGHPAQFIRTALDVLRPGGLLIISVPAEDSFISLQINAVLNMPPHHVTRWRDRTLTKISDIFNLELLALGHDKLSPLHFEPLVNVLATRTVCALFNVKVDALVTLSKKSRIINRLAGYIKPVIRTVLEDTSLWPVGHSVTAIYRKAGR